MVESRLSSYVARINAFDPDLLDASIRRSLVRWIEKLPKDDLAPALEMLEVAFSADEIATASMLWLIDRRLAPHVSWLGSNTTLFLELLASHTYPEGLAMSVLESLQREDAEGRRKILAKLPIPNLALPRAHEIMRAAWDVCLPKAQYREPIHRGQMAPVLNGRALIELCVFIGEHVASLVPKKDAVAFEACIRFAQNALEGTTRLGPPRPYLGNHAAKRIANACQEITEHYLVVPTWGGNPSMVSSAAVAAIGLFADSYAGTKAAAAQQRFLRALDDELCRLDVVSALGKKSLPSPIACRVYRANHLWLARLENGDYGLLQKKGRRASWLTGGRDEVLASIPDDQFEKAVFAAKD